MPLSETTRGDERLAVHSSEFDGHPADPHPRAAIRPGSGSAPPAALPERYLPVPETYTPFQPRTFGRNPVPQESCRATTVRGTPCRSWSSENSPFCVAHNPTRTQANREASARGARASNVSQALKRRAALLGNHTELASFTAELVHATLEGAFDLSTARLVLQALAFQARILPQVRAERERGDVDRGVAAPVPDASASGNVDAVPHQPEGHEQPRDPRSPATAQQPPNQDRTWANQLDPSTMEGVDDEVRILRQVVRDSFVRRDDPTVRQAAETLRRLLRDRASLPALRGEDDEEAGWSADLRRVLNRVGTEMGIDV